MSQSVFKASLLHRGDEDDLEFELEEPVSEQGSENALDVHEFGNGPEEQKVAEVEAVDGDSSDEFGSEGISEFR